MTRIDPAAPFLVTHDHRCARCGCQLKVEIVRKPVYAVKHGPTHHQTEQFIKGWTEREEVSDCSRCTGSY